MLMRSTQILVASALLAAGVAGQEPPTERAARLRAQLAEIQGQQTELQTRLTQIDEEIKPENIERSLAGVGSTRPEELREARRRQLETQRRGIQSQLDTLTTTQQRLESAVAAADAESYRQTVGPNSSAETTSIPKSNKAVVRRTIRQKHRLKRRRRHQPRMR